MRIKTLMVAVLLALFSLALPQAAHAQYDGKYDGDVQSVVFDKNNYPILKFSNASIKRQRCGGFVAYTLMDNQEEAFAVRAAHLHWSGSGFMARLPENGWLYITPSRIIFNVEAGDKSHSFDIPRTALKDKPVDRHDYKEPYPRLQFNLREKLPGSNSSTQKFTFFLLGDRKCYKVNPEQYLKFLERAVDDFNGTMAKFKQVAASLKQSGKIDEAPPSATPPGNSLAPPPPQ